MTESLEQTKFSFPDLERDYGELLCCSGVFGSMSVSVSVLYTSYFHPWQKMQDIVASNQDYSGLLLPHDDYFTIKHYAGDVSL